MLQDYVDALGKKGPTDIPDFGTYQPGTTQRLAPAQQGSHADPLPKGQQAAANALPLATTSTADE